jgi:signal transduction histidine kinase
MLDGAWVPNVMLSAEISLEKARRRARLRKQHGAGRKMDDDLRRCEAALAETQQISRTGTWLWKVGTGDMSWSAEHFRIFALDPATARPSYAAFMERIHAADRAAFEQVLQRAVRERSRFQHELRIVLSDGSVKHLQSVGRPELTDSGDLEFVGAVMDITERRRAEEALRGIRAELAHEARITMMGELAASLSHEVTQPLSAIVTNGEAGLRLLDQLDLDEARRALSCMVRDARRAGAVILSFWTLAKKSTPQMASLDINDAIKEVLTLACPELQRHGVVTSVETSADHPLVFGDRVQLQQVLLNLIMNAVESMSTVTDRAKLLTITSEPMQPDGLLVQVKDTGPGLDPAIADRIFDSFFTTKPEGLGMGLSICRSIIEVHGGRISASAHEPHGAAFRFTLPGTSPA